MISAPLRHLAVASIATLSVLCCGTASLAQGRSYTAYFTLNQDGDAGDTVLKATDGLVISNTTGYFNPADLGISLLTNELYVANPGTNSVVRVNRATNQIDLTITSGISGPNGIAFDNNGLLLVTNLTAKTVTRYNPFTGEQIGSGAFISGLGGTPYSLTVGPSGDIFVVGAGEIDRYSGTTGAFLGMFTNDHLSQAHDLAFAPNGNLYVANTGNNSITRYSGSSGAFIDTFASDGRLFHPTGLAFAPDGELFVTSESNNVAQFDPNGAGYIFLSGQPPLYSVAIPAISSTAPISAASPEPNSLALLAVPFIGLAGHKATRRYRKRVS